MLTDKGEEVDCVVGLEMGAEEYFVKPIRLDELVTGHRVVKSGKMMGPISHVLSEPRIELGDVHRRPRQVR